MLDPVRFQGGVNLTVPDATPKPSLWGVHAYQISIHNRILDDLQSENRMLTQRIDGLRSINVDITENNAPFKPVFTAATQSDLSLLIRQYTRTENHPVNPPRFVIPKKMIIISVIAAVIICIAFTGMFTGMFFIFTAQISLASKILTIMNTISATSISLIPIMSCLFYARKAYFNARANALRPLLLQENQAYAVGLRYLQEAYRGNLAAQYFYGYALCREAIPNWERLEEVSKTASSTEQETIREKQKYWIEKAFEGLEWLNYTAVATERGAEQHSDRAKQMLNSFFGSYRHFEFSPTQTPLDRLEKLFSDREFRKRVKAVSFLGLPGIVGKYRNLINTLVYAIPDRIHNIKKHRLVTSMQHSHGTDCLISPLSNIITEYWIPASPSQMKAAAPSLN
jgi:hypothetical protein